jgi:signal transduction histidine kinase
LRTLLLGCALAAIAFPGAAQPARSGIDALLMPMLTNDQTADAVLTIAREARAAAARDGTPAANASLISSLECRGLYRQARAAEAAVACDEALRTAATDIEQFAAQRMQGTLLTEQSRFADGTAAFLASLAAAARTGDDRLVASALSSAGTAAQFAGAYAEAVEYYVQAIEIADRAQMPSMQALIGSNLGYLMLDTGDPDGARAQFESALAAARAAGHDQAVTTISWGIASARLAAGDAAVALQQMLQLATVAVPTTDPVLRAEALQMLARARLAVGQPAAAVLDARRAVQELEGHSEMRALAASVLLVEALTADNRPEEGLAIAQRTLERLPAGARLSAELHQAHARTLAMLGRHRDAYEALQLAQRVREQQSNARAADRLAFMRARGEARQREREVEVLRAERARQEAASASDRVIRNLSIALVAIALVAALVIAVLARRRQQLLLEMTQRQNLDALGKLTGGVAHDFNNLMTIIRQAMSLLRREPAVIASPAARALVDDADSASEVCGRITTQLLTYARQQRMETIDIRVANLMEDHRALFQRALGADIQLNMAARDPACVIRTDSSQLIAAVMNLLANARDALPTGGLVHIEIRRRDNPGREARIAELPAGRYVGITVRDNGPGMPPEVLQHATTPFFTTKAETGGTGLGLSTVEGFTRQSGGTLLLHSTPDRGTEATMLFPAVTD